MPQDEDQLLKNTFQASLLDRCMAELFNAELGRRCRRPAPRLSRRCSAASAWRCSPSYVTFMTTAQWSAALRDYQRALARCPPPWIGAATNRTDHQGGTGQPARAHRHHPGHLHQHATLG